MQLVACLRPCVLEQSLDLELKKLGGEVRRHALWLQVGGNQQDEMSAYVAKLALPVDYNFLGICANISCQYDLLHFQDIIQIKGNYSSGSLFLDLGYRARVQ